MGDYAPVFSALDAFLKGIERGEVERYSMNRAMENMEILRKAENIEES